MSTTGATHQPAGLTTAGPEHAAAVVRVAAPLLIAAATALAACGGPPSSPTPTPSADPVDQLGPVSATQVVARVNGVPILAADLEAQLRGGGSRETALRELIRFELLAQEARRRGLDAHPTVRRRQRRALANRFIRREFGDKFTEQSIPPALIQRAYERNRMRYDRPELVRVAFAQVQIPIRTTAEIEARARHVAARIHARAQAAHVKSKAELKQVADALARETQGQLPPEIRITFDELTSPRVNNQAYKGFFDAAFALRPGQLSEVVNSRGGYYVLVLEQRLEAIHVPLAAAEGEIRKKVFKEARELSFNEFVEGLERPYQVQINSTVLQELQQRQQQQQQQPSPPGPAAAKAAPAPAAARP